MSYYHQKENISAKENAVENYNYHHHQNNNYVQNSNQNGSNNSSQNNNNNSKTYEKDSVKVMNEAQATGEL